jgi:hypothetical protein
MSYCNNCGAPFVCDCDDDLSLSGWWLVFAGVVLFALGAGFGSVIKF